MDQKCIVFAVAIFSISSLCALGKAQVPLDIPKSADVSIAGIHLNDAESTRRVIEEDLDINRGEAIPSASFMNRDGTELLTVYVHPGSYKNSVAEFQVTVPDQEQANVKHLSTMESFVTGKGIKLGMKQTELEDILGESLQRTKKEKFVIFKYQIYDPSNSFLRHYNMPIYYGIYRFTDGRLRSFQFGFEYP